MFIIKKIIIASITTMLFAALIVTIHIPTFKDKEYEIIYNQAFWYWAERVYLYDLESENTYLSNKMDLYEINAQTNEVEKSNSGMCFIFHNKEMVNEFRFDARDNKYVSSEGYDKRISEYPYMGKTIDMLADFLKQENKVALVLSIEGITVVSKNTRLLLIEGDYTYEKYGSIKSADLSGLEYQSIKAL